MSIDSFTPCLACKRFRRTEEISSETGLCPNCDFIKCAACGKDFIPNGNRKKYCSHECLQTAYKRGKFMIHQRDEFRCVYCGKSSIEDSIKLAVDHIVPRSVGGPDKAYNLITSCEQCNHEKSDALLGKHLVARLYALVKLRNQLNEISDEQEIKF